MMANIACGIVGVFVGACAMLAWMLYAFQRSEEWWTDE